MMGEDLQWSIARDILLHPADDPQIRFLNGPAGTGQICQIYFRKLAPYGGNVNPSVLEYKKGLDAQKALRIIMCRLVQMEGQTPERAGALAARVLECDRLIAPWKDLESP